jgi:hypothetical protein
MAAGKETTWLSDKPGSIVANGYRSRAFRQTVELQSLLRYFYVEKIVCRKW